MTAAGSPGIKWIKEKTMIEAKKREGIILKTLLMT